MLSCYVDAVYLVKAAMLSFSYIDPLYLAATLTTADDALCSHPVLKVESAAGEEAALL